MWSDNETKDDLLGFFLHVDILENIITDAKMLPLSLGIYGNWGSGKSSLMKMIEHKFSQEKYKDDYYCIKINSWSFEGYDDAKAALIETILTGIEENTRFSEEVKNEAKRLFKKVNWMRGLGLLMKNIALPAATAYFTGGTSLIPFFAKKFSSINSIDDIKNIFNSIDGAALIKQQEEPEKVATKIWEFREEFKNLIDQTKLKGMIFILDDLDRCSPERIIENLEAIKLFLNVEKTAFIIGIDSRTLKHAINTKYINNYTDKQLEDLVKDYQEKLIQIPYEIPKLSNTETLTYMNLLFCNEYLSNDEYTKLLDGFYKFKGEHKFSAFNSKEIHEIINTIPSTLKINLKLVKNISNIICSQLDGNPRQIKRFLNKFTLRKRMAEVINIKDFNINVLAKLMVLEYKHEEHFRELYNWLLNDKKKILIEMEKAENLEQITVDNWKKEELFNWFHLPPKLGNIEVLDYFWLSRDVLEGSINIENMISAKAKGIVQQIIQINEKSKSIRQSKLKTILSDVPDEMHEQISPAIMTYFEKNSTRMDFDIICDLVLFKQQFYLTDFTKSIQQIDLQANTAPRLYQLCKNQPTLTSIIDEISQKNSSFKRAYEGMGKK